MTDDPKNFGARDRHRIDVDDAGEFRYWCDPWEVSAERLAGPGAGAWQRRSLARPRLRVRPPAGWVS